ncbi:hypothetical protein BSKO_11440 [Bryopsis sp. KO-2023]|nr:hypothetical protein BSKO_11440 [Bryopsis sp. KO-2023]
MSSLEKRSSTTGRYPSLLASPPRKMKLQIFGWGRGDLGQLGNDSEGNVLSPQRIPQFEGNDFVLLAGNVYNTAALTDDGEVHMAGNNDAGQLGNKDRTTKFIASRIQALDLHRVVHLAVGQQHTLAVTEKGCLVAWGDGEFGQLGHGGKIIEQAIPKPVKMEGNSHFVRCAAGNYHSLVLASNGEVLSSGEGAYGALGHGDLCNANLFTRIRTLWSVGVVQVACGEHHSAALSVDGRVFTWGRGKYGQLGLGDFNSVDAPKLVTMNGVRGRQVACGGDHTLLLGDRGELLSWGRSTWGQTGLGTTENQPIPAAVVGLENEYIIQISAGRGHSLAVARRGVLFAFGNGEQGQLGLGIMTNEKLALEVKGLPEFPILYALAAGDHSFAVFGEPDEANPLFSALVDQKHGQGFRSVTVPKFSLLLEAVRKSGTEEGEAQSSLLAAIEDVFSSPGYCLNAFSLPGPPEGVHLDIATIIKTYEILLKLYSPVVVKFLGLSCLRMLDGFMDDLHRSEEAKKSEVEAEWLRCLLVLWLNPLLGEMQGSGGEMVERLADVVRSLSPGSLKLLTGWLGVLQVDLLGGRIIGSVQRHLGHLTSLHDPETNNINQDRGKRQKMLKVGRLLATIHDANVEAGEPVPFSRFANVDVAKAINWQQEYFIWRSRPNEAVGESGLVSLCETPCVLTPGAKSKVIQSEAFFQKHQHIHQSQMQAYFQGIPPSLVTFLEIHIRRDHIVKDTLNQIKLGEQDLKKPLKVTFISNNVHEEGEDAGGLSKEFFQLLVQELFTENYGMFVYNQSNRTFWFNSRSLEPGENFELVGVILGLAIYNSVILDVHFPLAVYKRLLGFELTFSDLKEAMPELGRGLQQLLDFEGDVESTFCQTFEVEYDYFGEMRTHEFMPGGGNIPVTNENREEYVELYSKYTLEGSVSAQMTPFIKGFSQMCDGPALKLFRYEELELLVCGLPHLDFSKLKSGAKYEGGYHADHKVIQWFWDVLAQMPLEKKKRFLAFTTGCDRAPVGGLSELTLTIQRSGPDSVRLPSSHTCFNVVLLPEYASKEKLQERITLAIENAQGFGLQ